MLSIGKLVSSSARYYLDVVASGLEEYYTGAGEAPGQWLGTAAGRLGLAGEVSPEQLHLLLAGQSPVDGAQLGPRRAPESRVAGFDLTFSAPKSVSLLYGLTTPEIASVVRRAHEAAVGDALSYMERHATFARRGAGGARRIETTGLLAAGYQHRTSRSGDPQLHTHVLIANAVEGRDGRWSAPDARLFFFHGRAAGFVYQAALRAELATGLGVSFAPVRNGSAEVDGVPGALVRLFSTRRAEIEARLDELGATSARAAAVATLDTRAPKTKAGLAALHERLVDEAPMAPGEPGAAPSLSATWRARALEHGHDPDQLLGLVGSSRPPVLGDDERAVLIGHLLSADGLTEHVSAFERRDVVRAVAEQLPSGGRLPVIEEATDLLLASAEVVGLGVEGAGREERNTTEDLLVVERRLLETAASGRGASVGVLDDQVIAGALSRRPLLADEQRHLVAEVAGRGDAVAVVVGKAGAGKTTALDAVREAYESAGYRVAGVALAARAAAELDSGAGISSSTVATFFRQLEERTAPLGRRRVLVVDEAGMIGTRDLERLVGAATATGTKVVLVGDHRQLPEVTAGGAFASLAKQLDPITLEVNRRQSAAWEVAALDQLRSGSVPAALSSYDDAGRLHGYDTAGAARLAMVGDWLAARSHGEPVPEQRAGAPAERPVAWMLAPRRDDVAELNALARLGLRDAGSLGPDLLVAAGRGFAPGDEVLFLRNDRALEVVNGTRGEVTGLVDGRLVVSTPAGERLVTAEYLEAGHLDHGYASTIHKSQGATFDRAFVLGTAAAYREAGYVALSRARERTDLYVVTGSFETGFPDSDEPHGRDAAAPRPGLGATGAGETLGAEVELARAALVAATTALSVSRAKILAADLVDSRRRGPQSDNRQPDSRQADNRQPDNRPPGHHGRGPDRREDGRPGIAEPRSAGLDVDAYRRLAPVIGPPPGIGTPGEGSREAWLDLAERIETYRLGRNLPGDVLLGRRPPDPAGAGAYDALLAEVVERAGRRSSRAEGREVSGKILGPARGEPGGSDGDLAERRHGRRRDEPGSDEMGTLELGLYGPRRGGVGRDGVGRGGLGR